MEIWKKLNKNPFLQAPLTKMYGLKQKYKQNWKIAENFDV